MVFFELKFPTKKRLITLVIVALGLLIVLFISIWNLLAETEPSSHTNRAPKTKEDVVVYCASKSQNDAIEQAKIISEKALKTDYEQMRLFKMLSDAFFMECYDKYFSATSTQVDPEYFDVTG
ncbi:MAG: hypothetical protein Q7R98_01110 [Candidatus Jorgensenbacteria bacterium]|nr:hypothetical protein [Candidatus Jorgensenbacteria bacterium]